MNQDPEPLGGRKKPEKKPSMPSKKPTTDGPVDPPAIAGRVRVHHVSRGLIVRIVEVPDDGACEKAVRIVLESVGALPKTSRPTRRRKETPA
jgi:hypothetical protein